MTIVTAARDLVDATGAEWRPGQLTSKYCTTFSRPSASAASYLESTEQRCQPCVVEFPRHWYMQARTMRFKAAKLALLNQ